MRRREFHTLLGGAAAAWPLAARAQLAELPVIGILSSRSRADRLALLIAVIGQGLNDTGFVEGRNVSIEYRWAEEITTGSLHWPLHLVRRKVCSYRYNRRRCCCACSEGRNRHPARDLYRRNGSSPQRAGFQPASTGGNLTGNRGFQAELEPKRARASCVSCDPDATTIGVSRSIRMWHNRCSNERHSVRGADIGREIVISSTPVPLQRSMRPFATLRQMRVDALSVAIDAFFFDRATQIVVLAARHAVPASTSAVNLPPSGG